MILESALFVLLTTSAINQPQNDRGGKVVATISEVEKEIVIEILYFCKAWSMLFRTMPLLSSVTQEQETSRIPAAPLWAM